MSELWERYDLKQLANSNKLPGCCSDTGGFHHQVASRVSSFINRRAASWHELYALMLTLNVTPWNIDVYIGQTSVCHETLLWLIVSERNDTKMHWWIRLSLWTETLIQNSVCIYQKQNNKRRVLEGKDLKTPLSPSKWGKRNILETGVLI